MVYQSSEMAATMIGSTKLAGRRLTFIRLKKFQVYLDWFDSSVADTGGSKLTLLGFQRSLSCL